MATEKLKTSASQFMAIICREDFAPATVRNYKQKLHAILRFCSEQGIKIFDYHAAEEYGTLLAERVKNGEIGDKYAGYLKNLAYSFADFILSTPDEYCFVSHRTFISSRSTLTLESKELLNAFSECIEKDYAESSRRGYLNVAAPFLHFLEDNSIHVNQLTAQSVRNYLVFISPTGPRSMDTVVNALRVFLRFLSERRLIGWSIEHMSFHTPPARKKVPVAYTPEEIRLLVAAIDKSSPAGKRDFAIILLSLFTGLRSGDIRLLKMEDINWEKDEIHIIQHKTNRELITPMFPAVGNAIADYILNCRPESDEPYVFLSHGRSGYGNALGANTIIGKMRLYLNKSGIKASGFDGKDFHALRKTFATNLLISGASLESVSNSLGDAGIQAVKPYLALDNEKLKQCCPDTMSHPCRKEGLYA